MSRIRLCLFRPRSMDVWTAFRWQLSSVGSEVLPLGEPIATSKGCQVRHANNNRNRNRKLQTSKAPLKNQAQGTSLFTSAASKQRGFPIVRGRLRSGCQRVRECVKSEGFSKEVYGAY